MQIDLEAIEKTCNEIWDLTTQLRELATTARRSDGLSLTGGQKKLLKDEFSNIKKELKKEVDNILKD